MTKADYKDSIDSLKKQLQHHREGARQARKSLALARRELRNLLLSERTKKAVVGILTPPEHQAIGENLSERDPRACRCCNNVRGNKPTAVVGVLECAKCGAIFGTCYLGESYEFVLPRFSAAEPPAGQSRYYDFTTLGSEGIGRRHGWFDPTTKLITQVG